MNTYIFQYVSPLGGITMASDGAALTGLWFDGQKYYAAGLGAERENKLLPVFEQTMRWLDIYFGGKEPDFTPPLGTAGSPFRRAVRDKLLAVPYGQTVTYGGIAAELAAGRGVARVSAQAVGGAVGRNPISVIVPCHRVVGGNGSLTGYAGGLGRKLSLLSLEGADTLKLFVPAKGTAL